MCMYRPPNKPPKSRRRVPRRHPQTRKMPPRMKLQSDEGPQDGASLYTAAQHVIAITPGGLTRRVILLISVFVLFQEFLNDVHKVRSHIRILHSVCLCRYFRRLSSTVTLRTPKIPCDRLTAWIASLVALRNLVAIFSLPDLLGCSPSSVSATGSKPSKLLTNRTGESEVDLVGA